MPLELAVTWVLEL